MADIKELEKKIIGLTDELAYYKHAYENKCKQVDDLLSELKGRNLVSTHTDT